jgi:hypothetical protein
METTIELDASNQIVLTRALREAAGIPRIQKLKATSNPGRIILEMDTQSAGKVIKPGKLKVWTGDVPATPIEDAVEHSRHYTR